MADSKKYYWLKLKRDFFKRHDIRIIEEMPNGKDYVLFYLKLLLESVDHEGTLRFSDTIPYNEQMLSVVTNTNIDIVRSAMKLFIELKMIDVLDDQTIYMIEVEKHIGSETEWAKKKRIQRSKEDNVPQLSSECPTEKEKESEKEQEKEFHSFSLSESDKEKGKREFLGGTLGGGVVMLSEEEVDKLLTELSYDEFNHYVGIVRDCEKKGLKYKKKTHYQAIMEMATADRLKATKPRTTTKAQKPPKNQPGSFNTFDTDEFYRANVRQSFGEDFDG
jgi:predicted phage replisome organizer